MYIAVYCLVTCEYTYACSVCVLVVFIVMINRVVVVVGINDQSGDLSTILESEYQHVPVGI